MLHFQASAGVPGAAAGLREGAEHSRPSPTRPPLRTLHSGQVWDDFYVPKRSGFMYVTVSC